MAARFVWPPSWTSFTQDPERPAAFKVTTAGNLEVALDLTREIAGARLEAPMRGLVQSGEVVEAVAGPTMTYEESKRAPPREPGAYALPLQQPGRPAARPLTIMTESGPAPAPPGARGPQKPYERREFAVALIPGAAVTAFRDYLARLPPNRRSPRWYVWGAAWSIYLSEIQAPAFGYFVQAAARGGLIYSIPEVRAVGRASRPAQVPDTVVSDTRGGRFVPVVFYTVSALERYVMGLSLRNPEFDNYMRENGWAVIGRIPRAGNGIWGPTRAPTRRERQEVHTSGVQVPLPESGELGEAPPLRPRQSTL